jgi:hypothetical protein
LFDEIYKGAVATETIELEQVYSKIPSNVCIDVETVLNSDIGLFVYVYYCC